jgi:branched-chain amino acid transport system ATP-binding protein
MVKKGLGQDIIVKISGLVKHFGEVHAVDEVDMQIFQGEVLAIVGSNGAGKTTLLRMISGGHSIDRGNLFFQSLDVSRLGLIQRARLGIIYSFQIPALFENLSTLDCLRIALLTRERKTILFFPTIEKFPVVRKEAEDVLNIFQIPKDVPACLLPHGQRKLLDVAMAFVLKPRLLLLDEPTSGVSTKEKGQVMDTIMPIIRQTNTTTVIVEHDMEIVTRYSDRVIVMDQGRVLAQGTPQEVLSNPEVGEVLLWR